ncbi:hypothetical protein ODR38_08030 [Pediococcus acidilactici]
MTNSSTSMLLYRIIVEHQDELLLFHNIDAQLGLIQEITSQLAEFKQGNVSPENLSQIIDQLAENEDPQLDLMAKLHDLNIIYTAYDEAIQQKFVDSSDILRALTDQLAKMDLHAQSFVISGFSNFTAEELNLIQTLIKANATVVIDLVMERNPLNEKLSENSLFFAILAIFWGLSAGDC